jgi:pilus assembly protein CpaB
VQRLQPMLILILALVCGGIAAYMANGWLKNKSLQTQKAVRNTEMTPVVVAAKEIVSGSVLSQDLVKVVEWPRDNFIAGAISELAKLNGRVNRQPLVPGEIILESKLAPMGSLGGLAGIIQNDKRAVTVKVDEASGVAGFVMPGNRVDVLLTLDKNEFKDDPITQSVLQNILVLGKGQDIEQPKNGEKPKIVPTVTLEVGPQEGERLALAAKEGHITLALRGWAENVTVPTTGVRTSALVRSEKKPEPAFEAPIASPCAPPKKSGVELLRGVEREVVNF